MEVALKQIDRAEIATLTGIELNARDEDFAGGSMTAIAERLNARPNAEGCFPFLITADHKIAGFLMLRKGQALPEWAAPDAVSLHNFRISRNMQEKGCGTTAVLFVARWIAAHWPHASKLMLSVNLENTTAREFYLRCGFQETGESFNGRLGMVVPEAHMAPLRVGVHPVLPAIADSDQAPRHRRRMSNDHAASCPESV